MPDLRPPLPHPSTTHPLLSLQLPSQAAPFVPLSLHEQFAEALSSAHLRSIITATAAGIPAESKNWSTEWFEGMTLGQRGVVSNTIRLATVVEGGGGGLGGILSRAAAWGCQLEAGEGEVTGGLGWQVRRFWRGFRVPGEGVDVLVGPWEDVTALLLAGVPVVGEIGDGGDREGYSSGNANAIAWHNGRAHTLRIIQNSRPVRESDIRRQLDYITALPPPSPSSDDREAKIALLSWRHNRTTWSKLHSQLLTHAPNLPSFKKLYNSALSIALDPALPAQPSSNSAQDALANLLNQVRHGEHSPNRHADVTFGIVSFGYDAEEKEEEDGDSKIGLTFDHTPADCGAVMELSKILTSPVAQEGAAVECTFTPERLEFAFPPGIKPDSIPASVQEQIPRDVSTLSLNTAGRRYVSAGGLVDVSISLALQAAVSLDTDANGKPWPVIYQPVHQPSYYKGRCGPGCSTTAESITFLSSLFPPSPREETLTPAFEKYLSRRREIISAARDASPVGIFAMDKVYPAVTSAIAAGDGSLDVRVVKEVLEKLGSEINFTGFTIDKSEVVAGLSNVFAPDQLTLFYLQKPNSCAVTFSATGRYIPQLPGIVRRFRSRWEVVAGFLDGYARVHRKVEKQGGKE